jgi:hypothetical protein
MMHCTDVQSHIARIHSLVYHPLLNVLVVCPSCHLQGTRNVIKACLAANVPYLVYTSTVNVVFDGSADIKDGDELMLDYCRKNKALGAYSRSKVSAERMVLQMNGAKHDGSAWAATRKYPFWCREAEVSAKYCSSSPGSAASNSSTPEGRATPSSPAADTQAVADQAAAAAGGAANGQAVDKKPLENSSSGSLDAEQHPQDRDQDPSQPQQQQQAGEGAASPSGPSNQQLPGAPPIDVLHTCALRPSGIWGAGELRHQLRMVQMLQAGMLLMTIGEPTSLQDWCHVDNLVQAQVRGRRAGRLCGRCVWCVCVCV